MNTLDVWAMNLPYRRWMIKKIIKNYYRPFLQKLNGKNILEIGCGHGFAAKTMLSYFSPKKITATDLDSRMISSAKKQVKDPLITFEAANATKLPYKNSSFEAVFVYGVIHHIPGPLWKKSLDEIYRVLKKNGKAFIYDNSIESFRTLWGRMNKIISNHPYDSMYKKSEFLDYLKLMDFKILKEANLGRYFIVIAEKQR